MKRSLEMAMVSLVLVTSVVVLGAPAGSTAGRAVPRDPARFYALAFRALHGYLPLKGVATLIRAKAHAAAEVAALHGRAVPDPSGGRSDLGPIAGASWKGITGSTPPDANGSVGPNSYLEITNSGLGIYHRDGSQIAVASLFTLVGHGNTGDPMVLWDPDTQRFYFSLIGTGSTLDWGFSKDANPTKIPGSFCSYESGFDFPSGSIPDYPKLGQTKGFLMMGLNLYPLGSQIATEGDVAWVGKPQGSGTITTCPDSSTFKTGIFHDLRNQDGSQAFTPVPAIQTDPSSKGYVMAMSDIECPPTCGTGTLLTSYTLKPKKGDPSTPKLSAPSSMTVGSYQEPADAPQKGTDRLLDTLDGRITHAVSGLDPNVGKVTVWVSHCVLGGAGSEVRWYEVLPGATASIVQSGAATDPNLYVFNGGISNDRTVSASGQAAHGGAMVLGFNTSSATSYVKVQMVSKVGPQAQSGFVLVKKSALPLNPPGTCGPLGCRWGDYSGATPDPAASLAAPTGEVWLTNEFTDGPSSRPTWNWEATP
jgi:hypothetical protein